MQAAALARAEQGEDDDGSADDDQRQGSSAVTGALAQRGLTEVDRLVQPHQATGRGSSDEDAMSRYQPNRCTRMTQRRAAPLPQSACTSTSLALPSPRHRASVAPWLRRRTQQSLPRQAEQEVRRGGPLIAVRLRMASHCSSAGNKSHPVPSSLAPCSDRESRAADTGQLPLGSRLARANPVDSIATARCLKFTRIKHGRRRSRVHGQCRRLG